MSRPANPYDNATCESFMKTLKQEEIHCRKYRDPEDPSAHLEQFPEGYYNHQRLHSALGCRTPAEFEQDHQTGQPGEYPGAPAMSFFRHGKSIDPMPDNQSGEPQSISPPTSFR